MKEYDDKVSFVGEATYLYVMMGHQKALLKELPINESSSKRFKVMMTCSKYLVGYMEHKFRHVDEDILSEWNKEAIAKAKFHHTEWSQVYPNEQAENRNKSDACIQPQVPITETNSLDSTKKHRSQQPRPKLAQKPNPKVAQKPKPKPPLRPTIPAKGIDTVKDLTKEIETISNQLGVHGNNCFVLTELSLFKWVVQLLDNAFTSLRPNFCLISEIANSLIVILSPLSKYGRLLTKKYSNDIIQFNSRTNAASILCRIEKSREHAAMHEESEGVEELTKLKLGLFSYKNGDRRSGHRNLNVEKEVSDAQLLSFMTKNGSTKHILANVLQIFIVDDVCNNMSIATAYSHLSDGSLFHRAKQLFGHVWGEDAIFHTEECTVRLYLEATASLALTKESYRDLAIIVVCELSSCLTNTRSSDRKHCILPFWQTAQMRIPGGGTNQEGEDDYCGGEEKSVGRRRSAIFYFNCILARVIEDTLVESYQFDSFGPHGFFCSQLCLGPSVVETCCNFSRRKFFEEDLEKFKQGIGDPIKRTQIESRVAKINLNRNLVFESKDQVDCLELLLGHFRSARFNSAATEES